MWCIVVNRLLRLLSETGVFTRAYADDVIIVIIGDDQGIASDLMGSALSIVEKWRGEVQITVNPGKDEVVLITRKYKTKPVTGLNQFQKEVKVSKEAKYLGIVLDYIQNWSKHLEYPCGKVTQAY